MKNIYNKGPFRNHEYAKHLRPFLKTYGNRKWRRTAENEIKVALDEETIPFQRKTKRISRKHKKKIKLKTKEFWFGDLTSTYIRKYKTIRGAMDSLKRNNVIKGEIIT